MSIINKLLFKLSLIKSLFYFPDAFSSRLYERYIGHSKIIAWHKGSPMYSTVSPPLLSSSFANKLTTAFLSSQQHRPLPYLMDIAITDKCNLNCDFCSFIGKEKKEKILSKEELIKVINDAVMMGVSSVNFVGGEPLLREDLPEIIKELDQKNAITGIFTNGYFLEEKARSLKQAGLTSVRVSIDSADEETHDKKRNKKGLFKKAVNGLIEAKKQGLITAISCCITSEQIKNSDFEKLIELGKKLKVNELFVFEMLPVGGFVKNKMSYPPLDINEAIRIARPYNLNPSYPGIVFYQYIADKFSLGCSGGISYLYISPYGEVFPCDFHNKCYGNIRKKELPFIWQEMSKDINRTCIGCKMKNKSL